MFVTGNLTIVPPEPTAALSYRIGCTGRQFDSFFFGVQGNIILYAAFIKSAAATVGEAKSTLLVPLNVFKYPPGNEPKKTVDDGAGGRKTLPEKEENPPSVKVPSLPFFCR